MKLEAVLLLAVMGAALLLSSGVALALNVINCKPDPGECYGTPRPDLMRASNQGNFMAGRDGGDTLKGSDNIDTLRGQDGNDELFGRGYYDELSGGKGNDALAGGDSVPDDYLFLDANWGNDTIQDKPNHFEVGNRIFLIRKRTFTGTIITDLNSSSAKPEVKKVGGTSTINWGGNAIEDVVGSAGNDQITGNDDGNFLYDEEPNTDTDTIFGGGGNDEIYVNDGAGGDTVDCGGTVINSDTDTVYFDTGDIINANCERQNP
jgi:hypothetical protein